MTSIEPTDRGAWVAPGSAASSGSALRGMAATGAPAPAVGTAPSRAESAPPAIPGRGLRGSPVARLGPQTVGQLLDGGFEVLRFRFRTLMIVAAVVMLPLYALPALLVGRSAAGGDNPLAVFGDPQAAVRLSRSANPFEAFAGGIASGLGLSAAHMVLAVAVAHLVVGWATGADPGPKEVLGVTVRRLPVALAAWGLALGIKVLSGLACYVGLVFTLPVLSLLGPVVAAERTGPWRSLRRTWTLGRRRFGPLLGLSVLASLVSAVISAGLTGMAGLVAGLVLGDDLTTGEVSDQVLLVVQSVQVLANVLMAVVLVGATTLAYVDARVRTEALDLELEIGERFGHVG